MRVDALRVTALVDHGAKIPGQFRHPRSGIVQPETCQCGPHPLSEWGCRIVFRLDKFLGRRAETFATGDWGLTSKMRRRRALAFLGSGMLFLGGFAMLTWRRRLKRNFGTGSEGQPPAEVRFWEEQSYSGPNSGPNTGRREPRRGTMTEARQVKQLLTGQPVVEGAGVRLKRLFGFGDTSLTDPFLLLDHFKSDRPEDFLPGFPWHPHRGIETITYVLRGDVEHGDSLGNQGTIGPGDVQWMTAGSGIIHQEMPQGDGRGSMDGFQLWANLPAASKMMPPRYRDVKAETIPAVELPGGIRIRVIAGSVGTTNGPMNDIVIEPEYLDVFVPAGQIFDHPTTPDHTVLIYVFEGQVGLGQEPAERVSNGQLAVLGQGSRVRARAEDQDTRFIMVSGKPLGESVAWRGPIVMNTEQELSQAFEEYRNGTFIKSQ